MPPTTLLPYSFRAPVVHGDGYGHVLGYPTANVDAVASGVGRAGLQEGVYAGYVRLDDGQRYKAGMVIGSGNIHGQPKVEAHLLGFEGDLYGRELSFEVVRYLRPYRVFDKVDELIAQIGKDMEEVARLP